MEAKHNKLSCRSTAGVRALVLRGLLFALVLPLCGCPAPWSSGSVELMKVNRTEEELDRGEFIIEGDKIVFERRHVARYYVIEDTIDGRKIFIYHGRKSGDEYFAVLGQLCPACSSYVKYEQSKHEFVCPYCASRYDDEGRPIFGPAKAGLERWEVELLPDQKTMYIQLKRDPKYTSDAPGSRT